MKRFIAKRLTLIVCIIVLVLLLINYVFQISAARENMKENAAESIAAMENILKEEKENMAVALDLEMLFQEDGVLYVVERESGIVLECTKESYEGKNIRKLGISIPRKPSIKEGFSATIAGERHYCVFDAYEDIYIGMSQPGEALYAHIPGNMLLLFLYLSMGALAIILLTLHEINKYIIKGMNTLIAQLTLITNGNLDTRVSVTTFPEFQRLNEHINKMTDSLLGSSMRISKVLDSVDLLIGVYEYQEDRKQVIATGKVGPLLLMSEQEKEMVLADKKLFEEKIKEIRKHPLSLYKDVYRLPAETECYIKIETFTDKTGVFGVIMDVTEEIQEKQKLQHERDYDLLTELLTRRAFYHFMNELYKTPHIIKQAVLMMFDLDGLKYINDNFGHANGDKAIQEAANILNSISAPNKLVARLSGDEFAVFLYGADSMEELEVYIHNLYERMLQGSIEALGQTITVHMSGGYVFCKENHQEFTQLLKMADRAMYISKKKGKGRFSQYRQEKDLSAKDLL